MSDVNVSAGSDAVVTPQSAPATPSAPPAAATPAAIAPQSATPAAPQAPATGAPGDGWVPSYRIRETREAAEREANTRFAAREAEIRKEAEQYRSQLHALVGVQPPQNPEVEAVRSQFASLYPGLAKMEDRAAQLEALLERQGDMEAQNAHYWQTYGRQTMDRLFEHATTTLGAPLTDEAKRTLHGSFLGFVQSSPEMSARYSNDPSIVDDFWKAFSSSFIDPARRVAATTVTNRAGVVLPQDTPGGAPRMSPVPQPSSLDERAANAWAIYQQNAKQ